MSNARRPLPASFVVRMYRADADRPEAIAGLVEDIERGVTRSFRDGHELLRVLATGEAAPAAGAGASDRLPGPHPE